MSQNTTGRCGPARDRRLDLARGLALVCLYVDHLPGNAFSRFTLHAYGFCDAADVFVLIAGLAAGLAYCTTFQTRGWLAGLTRVVRRIVQVYATHLTLLAACAAALAMGALTTGRPDVLETDAYGYFGGGLAQQVSHALSLRLQPHYLNILPLYVVLLAAIPAIVMLLRLGLGVTLAVSIAAWALPRAFHWNLPSDLHSPGWFFNPLAWQLLFVIGIVLAQLRQRGLSLPRQPAIAWAAAAYCAFALVAVAPWVKVTAFADWYVLPRDWMSPIDKQQLSLLRVLHVLALAYLAAYVVRRDATWLGASISTFFCRLGRSSLSVFAIAAIVDVVGWIVWRAGGQSAAWQFALIVTGVAIMAGMAWITEHRPWLMTRLQHALAAPSRPSVLPSRIAHALRQH